MADQDLDIRVRTTADTTGIRQTSAELDALQDKAAKPTGPDAATLAARQASLRAALTPVPAQLGGAVEEAAKVEAEMRKVGTASLFAGINIAKARQEAAFLVRELATGVPTTRTLSSLLGSLGPYLAGAVGAGFALNRALVSNAERQLEINQELDVQLTKVTELQKKWTEIGHTAATPEDVTKLTSQIIPALDGASAKFREFQNQGISGWKELVDTLTAGIPGVGRMFENLFQTQANVLAENYEGLRKAASAAARVGEEEAAAFQTRRVEDFSQAIDGLINRISEQRALQKQVGTENIESYTAIGQRIQNLNKQLEGVMAAEKERNEFGRSMLSLQDEQAAKEEDIESTLEDAEKVLKAMGVDARDLNAAFAEGERRAGAEGAAIRKAATEAAKARGAAGAEAKRASKELAKDLQVPKEAFLKAQQQAALQHEVENMALEQKRREAVATGDTERAKAIEDQLKNDRFARDQEKERLQRYSALQENIGAGADEALTVQKIGTEGARKYYAAQARLADIYRQEAEESGRAPAKRKEETEAEVKKYGRVLTEPERLSERVRTDEEARQQKMRDDEAKTQKALEERTTATQRGITQEQLRIEREAQAREAQAREAQARQAQPPEPSKAPEAAKPADTSNIESALKENTGWLQKIYQLWQ
jgi:hypothetical protein